MKVSIITPAYNQAAFLAETIESVLKQDYPDIEYLVLDDGSNDDTEEVVKPYLGSIIYSKHKNIGESKTVNKGYLHATGELIGIVNADDPLFSANAISLLVEALQGAPTALAAYPDWVSIDSVGELLAKMPQPNYTIENMLVGFEVTLGPGMLIRRSALGFVGLRDESLKYTGDLDLSFRLAIAGDLVHVPKFLATHRVHASAASSTAQGSVMAAEVLRLALVSSKAPELPKSLQEKRLVILARASRAASHYCGDDTMLKLKLLANACFYGFCSNFRSWAALKGGVGFLIVCFYNFWRRTLLSPFWWRRLFRSPGIFLRKFIPKTVLDVLRGVVRRNLSMRMKRVLAKVLSVLGLVD